MTRKHRNLILTFVILTGLLLAWKFWLQPNVHASRVAQTKTQLVGLSSAISNYHQTLGEWPSTLADLQKNNSNFLFYDGPLDDAWGGPIQMSPPIPGQRGQLISHGSDRAEGGSGAAADLVFPLPSRPPTSEDIR